MLSSQVYSLFTKEVLTNMPVKESETNSSLSDIQITEKKIIEKIKSLKQNSAPGPDEIGTKLLKTASQEIAKPLCYIFNDYVPDWSRQTGERQQLHQSLKKDQKETQETTDLYHLQVYLAG